MTWSYTPGASDRDIVRDLVQDNDPTDPLISNEAIDKYLTGGALAQDGVYLAAVMVATEIRAKFARAARSIGAGGTRVDWGDRVKDYDVILADLRSAASGASGSVPFAGGISESDVRTRQANADRVRPLFERDPAAPASNRLPAWR